MAGSSTCVTVLVVLILAFAVPGPRRMHVLALAALGGSLTLLVLGCLRLARAGHVARSRNIAAVAAAAAAATATTGPSSRQAQVATQRAFALANCVCFDVDSTVTSEEGIDVLAAFLGKGDAVAEWTRRAMGGNVPFQEAIRARLDILKPSRLDFDRLLASHKIPLTPGMSTLVPLLRARGQRVVFISGGLMPLVMPVARMLSVSPADVFAIDIKFTSTGAFAGFDEGAYTAASGGKPRLVAELRKRFGTIAMVGDGATDLEAKATADAFVGFGANVVRAKVRDGADWFVHSVAELEDALKAHPRAPAVTR